MTKKTPSVHPSGTQLRARSPSRAVMAAFGPPAGWDFHAHGHAAFAPEAARHVPDGRGEGGRASTRRAPRSTDPELVVAMKRAGAQHALFIFRGASPQQRQAMGACRAALLGFAWGPCADGACAVNSTDGSDSTALHWAAEFGFTDLVAALLTVRAPSIGRNASVSH